MTGFNMLAMDIGASNGRVVLGVLQAERLVISEIHRFENNPVSINGILYWDVLRLLHEMKQGILKCQEAGHQIDSIGVNTWGNTIGLLDKDGDLLMNPVHYRDTHAYSILPELDKKYKPAKMFDQTLFKPMNIQPTVLLSYFKKNKPQLMNNVSSVLMISDLLNYFLSGEQKSEQTMAATSQLLDLRTGQWHEAYMRSLELEPSLFPEITDNGTILGALRPELIAELGLPNCPVVVSVAGHDTASASGAISAARLEDSLYLSCGTWSCMGCCIEKPIQTNNVFECGITNDLGILRTNHLRFNHTGLWILQECRREWDNRGECYSWQEIEQMAAAAEPLASAIDTEDELFFSPDQMPAKVREYCKRTGCRVPETPGEIARTILESLAFRYRFSTMKLENVTGKKYHSLRIVGGGSRNKLFCQMIANVLNKEVIAGPFEATILGNFMLQGMAMGKIGSLEQGLTIIGNTEITEHYLPQEADQWISAYDQKTSCFPWYSTQSKN